MIAVVGATLAGMAAAARLARLGHEVLLIDRRNPPPPSRARQPAERPTPGTGSRREDGLSELDSDPHTIVLPASWRDLFTKTGRPLAGELGRYGLSLVPAPAPTYATPAGEITLPADRAGQWHALTETLGTQTATAWRDLLDRLDTTWLALRPLGVEAEFTARRLDRATRTAIRTDQTLADLARQAGPLGDLFLDLARRRDSDPRRSPGWLGTRLSIERTFGRWQLADAGGTPRPTALLVDILLQRLVDRGVEPRWAREVEHIRPGRVSTDAGELLCQAVIVTTSPWQFAVLAGDGPPRRLTPAATSGPRWNGWRTLLALPRLRTSHPGVYAASEFSAAGPEPWAQLLTGALVSYRVHHDLTGEDSRPVNRDYRLPPLRRGR